MKRNFKSCILKVKKKFSNKTLATLLYGQYTTTLLLLTRAMLILNLQIAPSYAYNSALMFNKMLRILIWTSIINIPQTLNAKIKSNSKFLNLRETVPNIFVYVCLRNRKIFLVLAVGQLQIALPYIIKLVINFCFFPLVSFLELTDCIFIGLISLIMSS